MTGERNGVVVGVWLGLVHWGWMFNVRSVTKHYTRLFVSNSKSSGGLNRPC